MFVRTVVKRLFSTSIPVINTLLKAYSEQIKTGIPQVQAFQSKINDINKLSDKEKDTFYRACINTSKDFSISEFLKTQGYLNKFPSLLIACNTRQIIHGIKDVKQKELLLAECEKLIQQIQDSDQVLTSRRFLEEAHGDVYLTQGRVKQAIQHYLKALKSGNEYFDKALIKADQREEELKKTKQSQNQVNYALLTAINIAQNLSQLSTKALFSNTKLNDHSLTGQIIKSALYSFQKFPQLKIQFTSYFLFKKTQFNHRIIDKKQSGQKIYQQIVSTLQEVLKFLNILQKTQPLKSLELLGVAAINYSSVLNFLNGIKGDEAEQNIKQVITTLAEAISDPKKKEEFQKSLTKMAQDMKAIK